MNAIEVPEKYEEIEEFVPVTVVIEEEAFNIPFLQNNFMGFKEAVAFKESQGKYRVVNTLGYLGKYQFGKVNTRTF